MKRIVSLFAICLSLWAGTNWTAAGRRWWAHVQFLASDELEGRNVGSAGFDRAAAYVAQKFEEAGLRPGGTQGFFQKIDFTELKLDESKSSITLERDGRRIDAVLGQDAILGVGLDSTPHLSARLVFVGYGLKIPEANWDDLAGQDLAGAVVVYLRGGPDRIPGTLRSHYSSFEQRLRALKAAGAVGTISLSNPKDAEVPWSRVAESRLLPRMVLADRSMRETSGVQFSATWNPDRTEELFTDSGHTFASLLDAANHQQPLPHFPLSWHVEVHTVSSQAAVSSHNIAGIRRGTDPQLSREFVVLSAHLDHLGVGTATGDNIYNGAMDDAAGVASLIEIAGEFHHKNVQTKRSLLFLAVTAEEKGELGSKYFVNRPSIDGRFVADINMDMYLPLFPLKYLEVQGLGESTLAVDIRTVCEQNGIEIQADKEPNKNRFIRSDQYSFIKKGVPALAFKFGYAPGGLEEKMLQNWYRERYHGVKDDLTQPVDSAAAARFDDLLVQLTERVADSAESPAWKSGSFFRRFIKQK